VFYRSPVDGAPRPVPAPENAMRHRPPVALAPTLACLLLAALAGAPLHAIDGALDGTFDGDGVLLFGAPSTNPSPHGALRAPDQAMVVYGSQVGTERGFSWRRLTPAGLGTSCGLEPPGATRAFARAATFDGAGRLLVAGLTVYGSTDVMSVARYLYPACDLDEAFSDDGYLEIPLLFSAQVRAILTARVLPTGGIFTVERIFLVGQLEESFNPEALIARLQGDGDLDGSWANGGIKLLDHTGHEDVQAAVLSSGRIVVGGDRGAQETGPRNLFLASVFAASGQLDTGFGTNGWVEEHFGEPDANLERFGDLVRGPQGRLYVASTFYEGGVEPRSGVIALEPDGDRDPGFGNGGQRVLDFGPGRDIFAHLAAVQSDGKLVVAGSGADGGTSGTAAARLTPAGAFDATFGNGGLVVHPVDPFPSVDGEFVATSDLALWAGRPLLVGLSQIPNENKGWIVRLANSLIHADGYEDLWAWE
jgi:uncharacterized delta-60 repeat protein